LRDLARARRRVIRARRGALRVPRRAPPSCRVTPIDPTPFEGAHQAASTPLLSTIAGATLGPPTEGAPRRRARHRRSSTPPRLASRVAGSLPLAGADV